MIKLKDLLTEGPAQNAAGLKNALALLRKDIIQAMGKSLDLGNSGYQMTQITNHLAAANKALNVLQKNSQSKLHGTGGYRRDMGS